MTTKPGCCTASSPRTQLGQSNRAHPTIQLPCERVLGTFGDSVNNPVVNSLDHINPEEVWPWVRGTRHIIEATVERLPGEHIMSASDYSGTHSGSKYWVFSGLYTSEDPSREWPRLRRLWRERHLPDGRRLSYKTLNDGMRRNALEPFLRVAESLSGTIFTVAVDKRMQWMATSPTTVATLVKLGVLSGQWSPAALEMMARVTLLWSLGLAALCSPDQHVSWITDQDDIAANEKRHTDLLNWAGRMTGLFIGHSMRQLDVGTTAIDDGSRGFEDFVAIPDLCAGMFAELVNSAASTVDADGIHRFDVSGAKVKSTTLSTWYFGRPTTLSRVAVLVKRLQDGTGMVSRWTVA